MQASSIIELNGRGIPAILHSAKVVDVCAYLKSSGTPAALVLSDRGEVRGVLSEGDIIGAAGRIGSSVMQMMAGELMREQAPMCQADLGIVEILEVLNDTASEFVLVNDCGVIKGLITFQDVAELLIEALGSGDSASAEEPAVEVVAQTAATEPAAVQAPAVADVFDAPAELEQAPMFAAPEVAVEPSPEPVSTPAYEPAPGIAPVPVLQPSPEPAPVAMMQPQAVAPAEPIADQPLTPPPAPAAQPAAVTVPEPAPVPPATAPAAAQPVSVPTVSSLLQGHAQPTTAPQAAAPQVPGVSAYQQQPAPAPEASHQPLSAAAAAARAIAAKMQAPQADIAVPGSQSSGLQAPGTSSRAGWASFKAG